MYAKGVKRDASQIVSKGLECPFEIQGGDPEGRSIDFLKSCSKIHTHSKKSSTHWDKITIQNDSLFSPFLLPFFSLKPLLLA